MCKNSSGRCGGGCGCHTPLKIEVNKTYLNKLGHKVRIICTNRMCRLGAPVVGLVGPEQMLEAYLDNGQRATSNEGYDVLDLVSEYREPDYHWFNVYKGSGPSGFHSSLANARHGMLKTSPLVGTYRIDLITGDILKES